MGYFDVPTFLCPDIADMVVVLQGLQEGRPRSSLEENGMETGYPFNKALDPVCGLLHNDRFRNYLEDHAFFKFDAGIRKVQLMDTSWTHSVATLGFALSVTRLGFQEGYQSWLPKKKARLKT